MRFILSLLLTLVLLLPTWARSEMAIHFIDVGQGGGVFIQKDGVNIMYDCGDTFAGPTVTDYLAALDVQRIDMLVVSHAHRDHMGGCIHVLSKFGVKKIYHNGSNASTGIWKAFLKAAQKADSVEVVEKDLDLNGAQILVAYDSRGQRFSKEADNSVLLLLVDGKVRALFTGDCETPCEKEVSDHSDVQSDILEVGHHGSKFSSSALFLNRVKPKVAVIQAGVNNQYHHPTEEALQRLKAVKAEIRRTDQDGGVVVTSNGQTFTVETEK